MKIAVVGAGVIGITSAWYLSQAGHEVHVFERESDPGQGASYANGGQISVSYSEPWASFDNLKKMISWLGKEESPLLFRPQFDPEQWIWGLKFMRECTPSRNRENTRKLVQLSSFSRDCLKQLRHKLDLQYDQKEKGIITLYSSAQEFEKATENAKFMQGFGITRTMLTKEQCVQREPALAKSGYSFYGGDFTEGDETGDAFKFLSQLSDHCVKAGVEFHYSTNVEQLEPQPANKWKLLTKVLRGKHSVTRYLPIDTPQKYDAVLMASGVWSNKILRGTGVRLDIYPAKGYSLTLDIADSSAIPEVSVTDSDLKMVFTKLGEKLRVAGTAEFTGFSSSLNSSRLQLMCNRTKEFFGAGVTIPQVADLGTRAWTGLRPATPNNVPYVQESHRKGLYLNVGHGTLGWTQACGSGQLIAEIASKG